MQEVLLAFGAWENTELSADPGFKSSYGGVQISFASLNQSDLPYSDALQRAMRGHVDEAVVDAMRREHRRAQTLGQNNLVSVKINLGVALMQQGNLAGLERALQMYEERRDV